MTAKRSIGWLLFFLGIYVSIVGGSNVTTRLFVTNGHLFDLSGLLLFSIGLIMIYAGHEFYYKKNSKSGIHDLHGGIALIIASFVLIYLIWTSNVWIALPFFTLFFITGIYYILKNKVKVV